jgi:hypothetical protein
MHLRFFTVANLKSLKNSYFEDIQFTFEKRTQLKNHFLFNQATTVTDMTKYTLKAKTLQKIVSNLQFYIVS